ncbi:MAG: RES domain-containing protein [Salinisphaera sp.]|jgi:RES domain-containing protein|nr:RES domain-containing protein [Salinisphaera sp.]
MPGPSDGCRYVYRVAARQYARDLSGEGTRLYGGRWTPPGYPALYTAEHPALAGFEKLVHAGVSVANSPLDYRLIMLSIPGHSLDRVQHHPDDPLAVVTAWLDAGTALALEVPSVVVPYATNVLINPRHPLADKISIVDEVAFVFDPRL